MFSYPSGPVDAALLDKDTPPPLHVSQNMVPYISIRNLLPFFFLSRVWARTAPLLCVPRMRAGWIDWREQELEKIYEGDVGEIFDIAEARGALMRRRESLVSECKACHEVSQSTSQPASLSGKSECFDPR